SWSLQSQACPPTRKRFYAAPLPALCLSQPPSFGSRPRSSAEGRTIQSFPPVTPERVRRQVQIAFVVLLAASLRHVRAVRPLHSATNVRALRAPAVRSFVAPPRLLRWP